MNQVLLFISLSKKPNFLKWYNYCYKLNKHNNIINAFKTFLLISIYFIFVSCESKDPKTELLIGDWQIVNTKYLASIKDQPSQSGNISWDTGKYILTFKPGGNFTTSMDEIMKQKLANASIKNMSELGNSQGTYNKDNKYLFMSYLNTKNEKINNKSLVSYPDENTLVLEVTKEMYLDEYKQTLNTQANYLKQKGYTVEEVFNEIKSQVLEYNVKIYYKKLK